MAERYKKNSPRKENGLNVGFLGNLREIARNAGQNTLVTNELSLHLEPDECEAVDDLKF